MLWNLSLIYIIMMIYEKKFTILRIGILWAGTLLGQNSICKHKLFGGSLFQIFWPKSEVSYWGIPKNIKKGGVFGQKMTSFCFCSHSANFCPIFFWRGSLNGTERQGLFGPLKQKNLRSTENWGQHPEHETFRALYLFSGPLGFFGWLIRGF